MENSEVIDVNEKFYGKRLLMLGSNAGSVNILKYVQKHGCYTIACDNLPREKSIAKTIADEHLLISTAEVDKLVEIVKERKIDAVMAGVSEFNLLKAMEISKKSGLRFYCNRTQWDNIGVKDRFRRLCIEYGVPCPKTYFVGATIPDNLWATFEYPLVVKPVDGSASEGVNICSDEETLITGVNEALAVSDTGSIIIEEYVAGNEFTAHYTINEGKATLSCADNRYSVAVHEGTVTTIPAARIYPSVYTDQYIANVNSAMIDLCESLRLEFGVLFVQGIYNPDTEQFWIFEGGLRSAAELPNRFLGIVNGVDYLQALAEYLLLGGNSFVPAKEDPFLNGHCCGIVSLVGRGGKVGRIEGLEEAVMSTPSILEYESRYPVGSLVPDGDTLRQLMIRFVMVCSTRQQMVHDVQYLNEHIQVFDEEGNNMLIYMDSNRIQNEF